jgi:hypothetical protein
VPLASQHNTVRRPKPPTHRRTLRSRRARETARRTLFAFARGRRPIGIGFVIVVAFSAPRGAGCCTRHTVCTDALHSATAAGGQRIAIKALSALGPRVGHGLRPTLPAILAARCADSARPVRPHVCVIKTLLADGVVRRAQGALLGDAVFALPGRVQSVAIRALRGAGRMWLRRFEVVK